MVLIKINFKILIFYFLHICEILIKDLYTFIVFLYKILHLIKIEALALVIPQRVLFFYQKHTVFDIYQKFDNHVAIDSLIKLYSQHSSKFI